MALGPLVPADETLNHQIVETFATVSQSDFSWTEKIWVTATATDGSLQASFGLGKYVNRGVMDGFGGVARANEQWVVRASRALAPDPDRLGMGPLRYEIVEPLNAIRCILEPNDHQPIAYDIVLRGALPPGLETPWPGRGPHGYRVSDNILRFHQSCHAEGWVEVEGTRVAVDGWAAYRDRSWGIRPYVGVPMTDLPPGTEGMRSMELLWTPMLLERPDGTRYGLFAFRMATVDLDGSLTLNVQAAEELTSGERIPFRTAVPDFRFDPTNRRMLGGTLCLVGDDRTERVVEMTPVSGIGFALGPGGYFGYGGHTQGQWMGEEHVTGDHIADTSAPETAREIHQLRDQLMRVHDPVGGGTGYANLETIVFGEFPELGLTAESSFF